LSENPAAASTAKVPISETGMATILHGVDGLGDEVGGVVDDVVLQAGGEVLRQVLHRRQDFFGGGERVGAGALEDQQRHRRALVEITVGVVVLGAELDAADVANARHAAVGIGPDDDVQELALVREAAESLDVQLEGAGPGYRRLVEHAGGDLDVLRLERGDDLAGGEVARRRALGIEPDAHGVVAGAEHPHVADAVEAGQHVLDLQRGVVGDVELVARCVGRAEVDDHHQVR
jgi:hypothetical protein